MSARPTNWLSRQVERARQDIEQWPAWMKQENGLPRNDDLKARLRDPYITVHGRAGMAAEAADRIEELERQRDEARARAERAEALLREIRAKLHAHNRGGDVQPALRNDLRNDVDAHFAALNKEPSDG